MHASRLLPALAAALALAGLASSARAELVYGITDLATSSLIRFDSATPGSTTTVGALTGITAGQTLYGIDFRPSNGVLYGVSANGTAAQLYTINLNTGAATAVGAGFTIAGNTSTRVSIDFNPVADALRVVTGSGQSYRVNANTGALIAQDTSLSYNGTTPLVGDVAYANNVAGATQTTLYAYEYNSDNITTIGSVNGTPNSPNGGVLSTVGNSGVVAFSAAIGFDISSQTGLAYLSLDDFASATDASEFYSVNLTSGLASFLGTSTFALRDFSVISIPLVTAVPEASTYAMTLAGLGLIGFAMRRRSAKTRGAAAA